MFLDDASRLQTELSAFTTDLATEMSKLPSQRSERRMGEIWLDILPYRSKLGALLRNARKLKRKSRGDLPRSEYTEQKKRLSQMRLLGQRLKMWDRMDSLVARHMHPVATPLLADREENISDPILSLLYEALHKIANPNPQSEGAEEHGCFADIPMKIQSFELMMNAAYRILSVQGRTENARFLDVGAGGGTKVLAASSYFAKCDGLEYDPDYAAAGKRFLDIAGVSENCSVFQGDGLTWDRYENYDVIYFYRPLKNDALLAQMERHIMATARPGTLIVAPYDTFLDARKGIEGAMVDEPILIVGASQSEADELRHEAERTGLDVIKRPKDYPFDTGFWSPLLNAASFN